MWPIYSFVNRSCVLLVFSVLLTASAFGQASKLTQQAMEASIAKQRQSVLNQVKGAPGASDGWFTTPWPTDAGSGAIGPADYAAAPPMEDCDRIPPAQLQSHIEETAKKEGFTPDLLRAVIAKESAFYPCAVSSKGAQGLMQLMPGTAADLGVQDPFNPKENISAGGRFLGQMLSRFGGDIGLALAAYNAGPGRVDRYKGLPPIPETLDYVSDIMDKLQVEPLPPPKSF